MFDIEALPGIEAFDSVELALDSEADINPGMERLQQATRAVAKAIKDPAGRARRELAADAEAYSLTFRFYRPKGGVADHSYFPPALVKQ